MGIQRFTARVARAVDVASIASALFDEGEALTGAPGIGLYTFQADRRIDIRTHGVPDGVIDAYESVARQHDPTLAAMVQTHAVTQAPFKAFVEAARHGSDSFRGFVDAFLPLVRNGHYAVAPIVVDGCIAGTLNFARTEDRVFDARAVSNMSAMSLHVSVRLTALHALSRGIDCEWESVLTRRGLEVADLAARGMTMAEVGRALGVSANTAKKHLRVVYERLGVASRAELATVLATRVAQSARYGTPPRGADRRDARAPARAGRATRRGPP